MINLKQKELSIWQERNFGNHPDDLLKCGLGMAEEVGEVCHHILKGTQKIREGVNGINKLEIADGVADTLIYGLQILSLLGLDAEKEIAEVIEKVLSRDWVANPKGDNKQPQGKCECNEDHGCFVKDNPVYCRGCGKLEVGLAG